MTLKCLRKIAYGMAVTLLGLLGGFGAVAQQANEWDMDGHAAKAKELLDQVNRELKLAAEAANKNRK